MDFWRAADILNRRKWLILLCVAVTTTLTFGATRLLGAKWAARVEFLTQSASSPVLPIGKLDGSPEAVPEYGPSAKEAAANQAEVFEAILKSPDVLTATLRKLGETQMPPEQLDRITVEASSPRLFHLQVTDANPVRVQALANTLADNLVLQYRKMQTQQAQRSIAFLKEQLAQADAGLNAARSRYDAYRSAHDLVGDYRENHNLEMVLFRLKDARMQRDGLKASLADNQAQVQEKERARSRLPLLVPMPIATETSPLIRSLQDALSQAELQLTSHRSHYADGHPLVKEALAARDSLKERLEQERAWEAEEAQRPQSGPLQPNPAIPALRQEIDSLKQSIVGHKAEIAALERNIASARIEIDRFKGVDTALNERISEMTEKMEARSSLAARLNAALVAQDAAERQTPIRILHRVGDMNPPVNTSQSRTIKLILMAAFCALLASSGLVIALDSIDSRLRNVRQAETALPARVIAAIPQPLGPVTYATLARATELHPQSLHSESYRFLGLHLLSPHGPKVQSLMVLSAKADQGSTTTLTNLAITLAQAGRRVIAVDANIRTAELHHVFGMPNEFGFTDLLENPGNGSLEKALHSTSVPNLNVITSGPTPQNPWELFRSSNLLEISRRLRERADFVLYDTPSALLFTDALNLAPVVDAAFLCVRALEPLTGAEKRMVELLEESDVQILGSVLSDVPAEVVEGYHNYRHYYAPMAAEPPALEGAAVPDMEATFSPSNLVDLGGDTGPASNHGGRNPGDGD